MKSMCVLFANDCVVVYGLCVCVLLCVCCVCVSVLVQKVVVCFVFDLLCDAV